MKCGLSVSIAVLSFACGISLRAEEIDFGRQILPLLSDNCFYCHGPDPSHRKAGLRLDDEAAAKAKTVDDLFPIVPGNAAASEVFKRLITDDTDELMPPPKSNKKLSKEQIALLKKWIDGGAKWGSHWSFMPLKKPAVPIVENNAAPVRNPIDAFVAGKLAAKKLKPSPEAEKTNLIRRVTLDLTGLPPTPEEVDAFVADASPDAYEKAVDRLLASPRYGERMAWDWMELARYADTNGYQGDNERTMWPWRDWVVKAFNENLPYDQFTTWQLAGDLLPNASHEQKLATGFNRNHAINGEGGRIAEENRVEYVMDMAETTGTVWMGMTFNCCRCHDHKFDPLLKKDYYSLFAFFNQTPVNGGGGDPQTPPNLEFLTDADKAKIEKLDAEFKVATNLAKDVEGPLFHEQERAIAEILEKNAKLKEHLKKPVDQRDARALNELSKAFEQIAPNYSKSIKRARELLEQKSNARKAVTRVMVMEDMKQPRKTYLLDKGLYDKRQGETTANTPSKLPAMAADAPKNRLGLAQWLTSAENPLTARVTVNRVWQMFFGTGLTKTSEDFGVQGEFPKHPELLDWLAGEFRSNGWDMKKLVRLIVTSGTYRQSSRVTPELLEADPQNRFLARGPRYRMPSWMIRDQALAASGLLAGKIGGPAVKPYQPSGVWEEATFGNKRYAADKGEDLYRRSLYVFWRRIIGPTMFFDTQSRSTCVVKPTRTNTPLHALATMNDTTYVEAARALAEKVLAAPNAETGARLDFAFKRVLSRAAKNDERGVLLAGLERLKKEFAAAPEEAKKLLKVGDSKRNEALDTVEHAAWTSVCLTILNLDEAVTRE